VTHSEFNASKTDPVHLLQIWILPETRGIPPNYEQKEFSRGELTGKLRLIAAKDPDQGAVKVYQDIRLFACILKGGEIQHELAPARHAWVQVARGNVQLNGQELEAGDGAAVSEERNLRLSGSGEILLFDLN
jgi:redox-sensitive bicupin YhaK (pirin superfamily)